MKCKNVCKWCEKEIKKATHEETVYNNTVYVVCDNCGEQTPLREKSTKED